MLQEIAVWTHVICEDLLAVTLEAVRSESVFFCLVFSPHADIKPVPGLSAARPMCLCVHVLFTVMARRIRSLWEPVNFKSQHLESFVWAGWGQIIYLIINQNNLFLFWDQSKGTVWWDREEGGVVERGGCS